MYFAVLLVLYLGLFLAHGGRIIGGDDVPIEDVPYQISFELHGFHRCGGAVLTPKFIITAAHCPFERSEKYFAVRAGTSTREAGGQLVNVTKSHIHPDFDIMTNDYDFAILELEEELVFSDKIKPIDLPTRSQSLPVGTGGLVTGWGLLNGTSSTLPVNLQSVTLEIYDPETCSNDYSGHITERMFCAGDDGKSPCASDSGDPLQVDGVLLGVVSWSLMCGGLASRPAVFANVVTILDFIEEITGRGAK